MESFIDTPSKPNIKGPPSVKGDIKTEQFSMLSAIFDIKKSPTCNNRNIYLNISLFFGTIITNVCFPKSCKRAITCFRCELLI